MSRSSIHRDATDEFALREVWGILRRHRLLLAVCLLVGLGAGLGLATLQSPSYQASTAILIGAQNNLSELERPEWSATADRVGTEMEVLRSRTLAKGVVDSLRLQLRVAEPAGRRRTDLVHDIQVAPDATPASYRFTRLDDGRFRVEDTERKRLLGRYATGQRVPLDGAAVTLSPGAAGLDAFTLEVASRAGAVEELARALEIAQPSEDVNVIRVTYRGSDPELVRDVPNVLTARFVELRESIQRSEARNAAHFLRQQLDTIAGQLASSEQRLRAYREAQGVIDPQLEASTRITGLAGLQADRGALEAERAALAQVLAQVRQRAATAGEGAASPYRSLIGFPSLLRNPAASELLRSLGEMENQRAALIGRRRATDPEVQVLTQRVQEIEAQLGAIASTYLQGLTHQIEATDGTLNQIRAQLDRAPAREVEFARLSRQPKVLQEMYSLLQTRLKEAEIAQAVEDPGVRIVDAADLPTEPVVFNRVLIGLGAALFGLVVGVLVAFGREYTDQSVRTRADVQAALGLPVLGLIPDARATALARGAGRALPGPAKQLLASTAPGARHAILPLRRSREQRGPALLIRGGATPNPLSDAFHRLHSNILFARPERQARTLLFTSPLPGDGKTTTAAHLAVTLAQSGLKVLLVDADLRRGSVHQLFGTDRGPGLSDLLGESPVLEGVLRTVDVGSGKPLRYIAAGATPVNPVQLLESAGMRTLIQCAAQEYDRVIIDSPPLHLFPDAAVMTACADAVVLVARAGVTPFDALVEAAEQLRRTNTPVVGGVLNGIDFRRDASYDGSYRWYAQADQYRNAETVEAA